MFGNEKRQVIGSIEVTNPADGEYDLRITFFANDRVVFALPHDNASVALPEVTGLFDSQNLTGDDARSERGDSLTPVISSNATMQRVENVPGMMSSHILLSATGDRFGLH
ncbi:hypothetical protein [Pararhizobium sp. PWRC1-1]|uniref:hypothetical protein n=1 Tax=Pararhizobium sp. PWRC1-1 TaxID=2804566 RepID=UPI003CF6CCBC